MNRGRYHYSDGEVKSILKSAVVLTDTLEQVRKKQKGRTKDMIRQPKSNTEAGGAENRRHERAIDLLVVGRSISEAARETGYRRETLSTLVHHNPVFKAKLNRRRLETRGELTATLREAIGEVIAAMRTALQSPKLTPGVVLQSSLAALPKLLSLVVELEEGITDARTLAEQAVPSGLTELFKGYEVDEREVQRLLQSSEAELDAV